MSRVDLPTPGSPPTRTRLPGTIPPPSTRFSSPQASGRRGAASLEISIRATGCAPPGRELLNAPCARPAGDPTFPAAGLRIWNSWSVFQARQCGHWPAQRRLSPPHSVHTNVIVVLGMGGTTLPPTIGIYKWAGNVLPAEPFIY